MCISWMLLNSVKNQGWGFCMLFYESDEKYLPELTRLLFSSNYRTVLMNGGLYGYRFLDAKQHKILATHTFKGYFQKNPSYNTGQRPRQYVCQ